MVDVTWEDAGRHPLEGPPGGVRMELCEGYEAYLVALEPARGQSKDWSEIARRGVGLLQHGTKDLRLLGDVVAALWMSARWDGFRVGMRIGAGLLSAPHWPEHVWPRDPAHRRGAIEACVSRATLLVKDQPANLTERAAVAAAVQELLVALESSGLGMPTDADKLRKLFDQLTRDVAPPTEARRDKPAPPREERVTPVRGSVARLLDALRTQVLASDDRPLAPVSLRAWVVPLRRSVWMVTGDCVKASPAFAPAWRLAREIAWPFEAPPPLTLVTDVGQVQRLDRAAQALGNAATHFERERSWQELEVVWWLDPHRACAEGLRAQGAFAAAAAIEATVASARRRAPDVLEARLAGSSRAGSGAPLANADTRRWALALSANDADLGPSHATAELSPPNQQGFNAAAAEFEAALRGVMREGPAGGSLAAAITLLTDPMTSLLRGLHACDPLGPVAMSMAASWGCVRVFAVPLAARLLRDLPLELRPADVVDPASMGLDELWERVCRYPAWMEGWRALHERASATHPRGAAALACALVEAISGTPELREATFMDGSRVYPAAVDEWLAGLVRSAGPAPAPKAQSPSSVAQRVADRPPPEAPPASSSSHSDPWESGLAAVAAGRLRDGLLTLEAASKQSNGERQRFEGALRLAEVLLTVGRADLGLPILEHLSAVARRFQLNLWDPQLAAKVTHTRAKALQRVSASGTSVPPALAGVLEEAVSQGLYSLLEGKAS